MNTIEECLVNSLSTTTCVALYETMLKHPGAVVTDLNSHVPIRRLVLFRLLHTR